MCISRLCLKIKGVSWAINNINGFLISLRIQPPLIAPITTGTCETPRQTSAIHRQKFHTDDVNLS